MTKNWQSNKLYYKRMTSVFHKTGKASQKKLPLENGEPTMTSSGIILWRRRLIGPTSAYNKRRTRRTAELPGYARQLNGRYITILGSESSQGQNRHNGWRIPCVANSATKLAPMNTSILTNLLRKVAISVTTFQINGPRNDCFHSGTRSVLLRNTTASTNVQSAKNARWLWSSASTSLLLTSGSKLA